MNRYIALILALALSHKGAVVEAVQSLRIASPLQALTISDPEVREEQATPRSRFLSKYKSGLEAEAKARKSLAERKKEQLQTDATSKDWASKAASTDRKLRKSEERQVEKAFDKAVAQVEAQKPTKKAHKNPNKYQFVGIINSPSSETPITWYARKKPRGAKWSLRLVHVNRDAIVKDLFNSGKVDIFARYDNTGKTDEDTNQPVIQSRYTVRERSWK